MNNIGPAFLAVFAGIITLAMLAVIVSRNAQSASLVNAGGAALAKIIGAAVAPVANSTTTAFGATAPLGLQGS
jgi:PRD1 phage membrane DNA delivery